ncbi:CD59 glycoprotein-like [Triplophysa rosa]|uniref:Lymphocyte antigen 6F-like n=1 Tax=Triplophysa rosa TaxID=992332 RepID=A0A9W7TGY6_TRIRA|nr:CD59 glycoprotein-like [Triplophysa rosa]KAI7795892.1 putative lymphocyte antigen 6F-like [Triplophysa rosa]
MDLRITIVLLSVFITGGHCIRCYACESRGSDVCEERIISCSDRDSCASTRETKYRSTKVSVLGKGCLEKEHCISGTLRQETGFVSLQCCNTDLCNGADGLYKGSFLLLLSPLFFYSLCH